MGLDNAFTEQVAFRVENIEYVDGEAGPSTIKVEYENPAVSMDTAGRFVTHEIIGGTTVRQKIGEDPIEADVSGVCKKSTAEKFAALRNAKYGVIYNKQLPNNSLRVQFASASTSPLSDGGAYPIDPDVEEFLYTFDLSCIEVNLNI